MALAANLPALLGTHSSTILAVLLDSDDVGGVVAGFGFGLYLVYDGFTTWQDKRLVEDTPTEKVRSAAAGRTELQGTCTPVAEPAVAPFTGADCVLATWEIEEYRSDDDGGHWETIDEGLVSVPFHLDDGTGRIRVEADTDGTYEIEDRFRTRYEVDGGDSEPEAVRQFLATHPTSVDVPDRDGVVGSLFGEERRYTVWIVPPGEDCYVLGGASPERIGDADREQLVLRRDDASDEFIVSTMGEERLVDHWGTWAPLKVVGGLGLSAVCLYILIASFRILG